MTTLLCQQDTCVLGMGPIRIIGLQLKLMRGVFSNANYIYLFVNDIPLHKHSLQASSSPIKNLYDLLKSTSHTDRHQDSLWNRNKK